MKYIAVYNPGKANRLGHLLYENLVDEVGAGVFVSCARNLYSTQANKKRWPWAARHSWQSWRERYKKNEEQFDRRILAYQEKHNLEIPETGRTTRPSTKASKKAVLDDDGKCLVWFYLC